jgi:hypothetical protein
MKTLKKQSNREGKIYLVDGSNHICVEDNGDRGIFQATGKLVANMSIKPTTVARFEDVQETPVELNIYNDMTNWNKQLKADLVKNSKGFEALAKYAKNWKV